MIEEFRRQIESLLPYVAPVLVYPRIDPGFDGWITGGTTLLFRTETNRFLITADHVVTRIDELRERSDIVVLLGGINAPPIEHDLLNIENNLAAARVPWDTVCCAEKYLKALLISNGVASPKSHDLRLLIQRIPQTSM
jgi:hypothetical protein